jgi:hypothetical protein
VQIKSSNRLQCERIRTVRRNYTRASRRFRREQSIRPRISQIDFDSIEPETFDVHVGYFVKTQDYFSVVDSEAEKIRQKLIQKLTIARSRSGMPNQKGIKDSLIRQLSEGKLQTGITLHYCRNEHCKNSPYLSAYNSDNPINFGAGHKCPGLKKGKSMRGLVCKSNLQIDFNVSVLE